MTELPACDDDEVPRVANVELTNRCNLNCAFCANGRMTRARGDMSLDVLKLTMERLSEAGVLQVMLNTVGETLLYPHLGSAMRQAKARGFFVMVSTNGQLLDEEMANTVLENGCDVLRLSVNSGKPAQYAKIHRNGDFDRLVANAERFVRLRNAAGAATSVRVRAVLPRASDSARRTKREIGEFWLNRVDEVEYVTFGNMGGRNGARPVDDEHRVPCATMWRAANILLDGSVSYCCCDFDGECVIGSLTDNRLAELWRGETFRMIRSRHKARQFEDLQRCARCDATRSLWYDGKTLTVSAKEAAIMDMYYSSWRQSSASVTTNRKQ